MTANAGDSVAEAVVGHVSHLELEPTTGRFTVLHVDDDPAFVSMAAAILERQDDRLATATATDPAEVLGLLESEAIDCVVSDYDMPGRNGIELLRDVRARYPELPFILFTGKGSEEVASEAISAGVTDYLQKEVGLDQYAVLANRITNVVAQHQAERRAERMSQQLAAILDNTTTPMFMKDADGRYLLVNRGFTSVFDLASPGDVTGRTDEELFPGHDVSALREHDRQVLEQGASIEVEERVPTDGGERLFLSSKVPIYDLGVGEPADEPVAVFGVARDITELRARERELRRRRDLLEHTERLASTGGWEADVETGVQRWTGGTYAIHDVEPAEFDPTVDAGIEFYHPDDRETIRRAVERCMREGESYEVELRLVTDAGRRRWVRASGDAVYRDGEIVTIRGAIQDITDLISREQALLEQNGRLEAFVDLVSHDLRTPLTTARGRVSLALEERDLDHLEAATDAHERLERLIDELVELARAGSAATDLEPVPLSAVVDTSWRSRDRAEATLVRETDATVRADADQLRLLLGNLLGNAIEHGGADVTVTVGDLEDGFFVEDDGPGIPPDEREAVFESGHTTEPDGTGFGLDVVQRIAGAHGWTMAVTEGRAGGARFEVRDVDLVGS